MARQTYITKNGAEKTFDVGQFRTLIRYRQEVQNTEDRRKSLNEIMMDLADSVHTSFSAVKHWYNGHNGPGSIEMISQIADYLGVETEKLLADPEDAVKQVFKNVETVYYHCTSVVYYIMQSFSIPTENNHFRSKIVPIAAGSEHSVGLCENGIIIATASIFFLQYSAMVMYYD